jgi:hypothetical protein
VSTLEMICPELQILVQPVRRQGSIDPRRFAQRLPLRLPVRVCGFDAARIEFSEDLNTSMVSVAGARIALMHEVYADDTLRIVNLENYYEADFRVVGPTRMDGARVAEWGVEAVQKDRSIWGIEFLPPPPLPDEAQAGTWIECRACARAAFRELTLMESEVLSSTGIIARLCGQCDKPTYWTYADIAHRPKGFPPFADVAPPPRVERVKKFVNTRAHKRVRLHLPILVRHRSGAEEVSTTENISVGGLATVLSMELKVGDIVTYLCPYAPNGHSIIQQAECRWSAPASPGGTQNIYGFRCF